MRLVHGGVTRGGALVHTAAGACARLLRTVFAASAETRTDQRRQAVRLTKALGAHHIKTTYFLVVAQMKSQVAEKLATINSEVVVIDFHSIVLC